MVLITMFQGDAVPASPQPGTSAQLNTMLSESPLIGAPGEPHSISDSSFGTPMSEGGNLSDDSEVFDSLQVQSLDTAACSLRDPQAYDTALPG